MRALIQRVLHATVAVSGHESSSIGAGLLVFLGVEERDDATDIEWLAPKIAKLRIFADAEDKMNRSLVDCGGEILVISQFTLHASTKKGNRPSFLLAAAPSISEPLYEAFCGEMEAILAKPVARGIFGADMKVTLTNDGPVTLLIDSRDRE